MVEFRSHSFEGKQKCASLKTHIWHKEDYFKVASEVLDKFWPLEPTRMIRITLQGLRIRTDRDSDYPVLQNEQKGGLIQFINNTQNSGSQLSQLSSAT